MDARIVCALVDVDLTAVAVEPRRTVARVAADAVDAEAAVEARRRGALVHVRLAVGSSESRLAQALVAVDAVLAGAAVGARRAVAFVDFHAIRRRSCNENDTTMT